MRIKKGISYSCGFLIAVLIIAYLSMQGVALEVAKVATGDITQSVEETGTVKSRDSSTVYLETSGRVDEVFVDKGDAVRKGTLLLKMDPTAQQIAALTARQARDNYNLIERDWEKTKTLYAIGALSRHEYETAETAMKNAANTYQIALLQSDQSTKNTWLRAPRTGVVLDRLVEPDLFVPCGTAVLVIGAPGALKIEADVLAEEAVNIHPGNPVRVSGKTTGGKILKGTVTKIAPLAKNVLSSLGVNQKRRTVTIALTGGNGQLRPGVDVDLQIITEFRPGTVLVPLSAIFDYRGKSHVFLVKKGRAKLCPVVKGIETDVAVEIKKGLKSGQLIVLKPDNTVAEGMRVKMPNKTGFKVIF